MTITRRIYRWDKKQRKVVEVQSLENVQGIPHYPITPDACGVHPDQIKEAEAHSRAAGVPTHFTSEGQPIIENNTHYRKYLRSIGMYHREAGYRDAHPLNR